MSNKLMTFETIRSVRKHPNADKLDIVNVAGYEAIVGRDVYKVGDPCFFVHPDASLPKDQYWAQKFLPFVSSTTQRVKAKNLRGEWSFGLVIGLHEIEILSKVHHVGEEYSQDHGVTKYEAPLPVDLSVQGPMPFNLIPTDEDRWQNFSPELIIGQMCIGTEKIDGTSLTVFCVLPGDCGNYTEDPIMGYCARNNELKIPGNYDPDVRMSYEPTTNRYWDACQKSGIFYKLRDYCMKTGQSLAIRGEIYGHGVQSSKNNLWSTVEKDVRWFSLMNIRTLEYLPFSKLLHFAGDSVLNTVPVIFTFTVITEELIKKIETARTMKDLCPDDCRDYWIDWNTKNRHNSGVTDREDMFEGVVCQYVDKETGKVRSFKIMNKPYDEAK